MTSRRSSGAEVGARIERQRQPQVRLQAALVELIEDDGGDAFQRRILLQQPREHALGDDLDARARARRAYRGACGSRRCRPTLSPRVCAMRAATARAASRRGSSIDETPAAPPSAPRAAPAAPRCSCRRRAAPAAPRRDASARAAQSAGSAASIGSPELTRCGRARRAAGRACRPGCTLKAAYQASTLRTTPLTRNLRRAVRVAQ